MKYRIAMWAAMGFVIACCWAVYMYATFPNSLMSTPALWALARLTCPIVFVSTYLHFGVALPWVLLANAATYAAIGLTVDTLRQKLHPAK